MSLSINSLGNSSSWFNTNNSKTNSSSNLDAIYSNLGDRSMIKNGSYGKLMKAYYGKSSSSSRSDMSEEDIEKSASAYSKVKSNADDLKSAASALDNSKLYEIGSYTVTGSDGSKSTAEYDYDSIYDKLSDFVDKYNSTLSSAGSDEASKTNKTALNMVSATVSSSNLLKSIGVTSDSDGKLSIDRDKLNKANISTIKTLFNTTGSYGNTVENKATVISRTADSELNKLSKISPSVVRNTSNNISKTSSNNKTTSVSEKQAYSSLKSAAESVQSAIKGLENNKLYSKGSYQVTDSEGNKKNSEYDYDSLYEKMSDFVKGYNSMVSTGISEQTSAANDTTLSAMKLTSSFSGALKRIGIGIDEDGKLSIDKDKFNSASIDSIKSMFADYNSYGEKVASKAASIEKLASNKISDSTLYDQDATLNNTINNLSYTDLI